MKGPEGHGEVTGDACAGLWLDGSGYHLSGLPPDSGWWEARCGSEGPGLPVPSVAACWRGALPCPECFPEVRDACSPDPSGTHLVGMYCENGLATLSAAYGMVASYSRTDSQPASALWMIRQYAATHCL